MFNLSPLKTDMIIAAGILLLMALMIYNHRKMAVTDSKSPQDLGVKELIDKVRTALVQGEIERIENNKPALFKVKEFNLEIQFVAEKVSSHEGGLQLKVVTAGMENRYSSQTIQKIMLRMETTAPQPLTIKGTEGPPPGQAPEN